MLHRSQHQHFLTSAKKKIKNPSCTCPEKSGIHFHQTICLTDLNISNQDPETELIGKDAIKSEDVSSELHTPIYRTQNLENVYILFY